eukprot:GEMP01022114.1.p1 GENE.GEMP01022114.1~~GEMP01022114.1.p1  ORF type:complete len:406 (+),score=56.45 GEMP01022114.1:309-1526(+)
MDSAHFLRNAPWEHSRIYIHPYLWRHWRRRAHAYALRITTPAIFILVLGFAALTAARSLQLCCSAMETCQESNYVRVLEKLFPPAVSKICVVMLATACFGLSCVYFVLASQTVGKIFGMSRWSTIAIVTPIIGPLAAFKRFSAFRYVSLLGVVGIFFLAALVVFEMPKAAAHVADNDKESFWKFQGWKNLIKGVNLCLNGFVVHNFVFAVYHELHNRTPTRMNKVIQRSVALECGVYFIVALFGFLSFRAGTPQNILLGYPLSTSVMSRHLAILGQGAMLIQLLVSCPMCLHPARAYGYSLVCSGPMRTRTHYISTVVLVAGVIIVYIIVPDVINLMGIVGGFACTTYAFFVPSLIVVQLRRQFPDGAVGPGAGHISLKLCAWLFCISLISYTAGFLSVIDLVQK